MKLVNQMKWVKMKKAEPKLQTPGCSKPGEARCRLTALLIWWRSGSRYRSMVSSSFQPFVAKLLNSSPRISPRARDSLWVRWSLGGGNKSYMPC